MLRYSIYNGATPKESPQLPLAFFYFSLSLSNTPLLAIRDIHSEWLMQRMDITRRELREWNMLEKSLFANIVATSYILCDDSHVYRCKI